MQVVASSEQEPVAVITKGLSSQSKPEKDLVEEEVTVQLSTLSLIGIVALFKTVVNVNNAINVRVIFNKFIF